MRPKPTLLLTCIVIQAYVALASSPGTSPTPLPTTNASHHDDEHDSHGHGAHSKITTYTMMLVMIAMLSGALIQLTLNGIASMIPLIKPPFSLIVFLWGMLFSALAMNYEESRFPPFLMTREVQRIDPHIILLVLLPPLVYESASHIDVHVFGRVFYQVLLLAGPGVIIATFLTGSLCSSLFIGSEGTLLSNDDTWDFNMFLILGSIVSATDPVAVVAALHELGAPPRLSTIIDGESLLNDGSAMVLFLIFLKTETSPNEFDSTWDYILFFIRLAGGGVAWGSVTFGLVWLVMFMTESSWAIESAVVITAVFVSFLMGETVFIVSGVLTVVTFGLWMSKAGKYVISPSSTEIIENFNAVVAHNTEVIIFFVAGVVSYKSIYNGSANDWINLGFCYMIIHVVRFVVVLFFYPIALRHWGYNLKVKEALIIVYGGLRGAVGLALGLMAAGELDRDMKEQGNTIMFITSGIVVTTMVINGSTTGWVYGKLRPFHPLTAVNEKGDTESLRQELVTMGFNKLRHGMKAAMHKMIEEYTFSGHLVTTRSRHDKIQFRVDFKSLNDMLPSFNNSTVNPTTDKLNLQCEYGGYDSNESSNQVAVSSHSRISATMTMVKDEHGAVDLFQKLIDKVEEACHEQFEERKRQEWSSMSDGEGRSNSEAFEGSFSLEDGAPQSEPLQKELSTPQVWTLASDASAQQSIDQAAAESTRASLIPSSIWDYKGNEETDGDAAEHAIQRDEDGSYWTGDHVRIDKSGSEFLGDIGRVTDPDWNGMVKIEMISGKAKGKIKSYRSTDLLPEQVAASLKAVGSTVILFLPKVGSFRGTVEGWERRWIQSETDGKKKSYKVWTVKYDDGDEDKIIESEVLCGIRLAQEVAEYEKKKKESHNKGGAEASSSKGSGGAVKKSLKRNLVAEYLDLSKVPGQVKGDRETKRDHTSALSLYSALDAKYNEFYENRSADGVALQVVNTGLRVAKERLIDTRTARGKETNTLKAMFEIELITCLKECMMATGDAQDQIVGHKFWYTLAKRATYFFPCGALAGVARWIIYRNLYRAFEVLGVYIRAHKEVLENIKKDKELARARLAILHQNPEMFSDPDRERQEYEDLVEGLNVRHKAIYNCVVMAEDRMAALIEQYPRVNLFQELVFMVRALLESQKKFINELVADGFFEESDVNAMEEKISIYMFQLDRMRHSAGAAWFLLAHDLQVPLLSEHKTIQELRALLSESRSKLAKSEARVDELERETANRLPSGRNPMIFKSIARSLSAGNARL